MQNSELYLKGAKGITPCSPLQPLAARLPELVGWALLRNCWAGFTSVRWPEIAAKQARFTTLHVSVVWAFLQKIKLFIINRDRSIQSFVSLFYFLSIISVFHRIIRLVENLFISLCVLSESSKTCYFRTVFTLLLNNGLVSHSHCWQIARLHCVCLSHKTAPLTRDV